ncbi:hypothetical protein CMI46_00185 [Candidatus Pacearchaeota archaeon]|nr:hypothetical protein [Candidatus Pacearchaeota archaeon]
MESKYKYGPFIVLGIFIFGILLYVNSFDFVDGVSLSPLEEEGLFDVLIYVVVFLFLVFVVGFIVLFVKNRKNSFNQDIRVVMELRSKSVPQFRKRKYKNL